MMHNTEYNRDTAYWNEFYRQNPPSSMQESRFARFVTKYIEKTNSLLTSTAGAMYYEPSLVFVFCLYEVLCAFGSIYVNVANGLGHIKTQIISGVIGAVLNIPLSVLFATICGMGLSGIKFATLLCRFLPNCVVALGVALYLKKKKDEM